MPFGTLKTCLSRLHCKRIRVFIVSPTLFLMLFFIRISLWLLFLHILTSQDIRLRMVINCTFVSQIIMGFSFACYSTEHFRDHILTSWHQAHRWRTIIYMHTYTQTHAHPRTNCLKYMEHIYFMFPWCCEIGIVPIPQQL